MVTRAPTALGFERCDSRGRRRDIEALFVRNGRADFPRAFESAYVPATADGGRSWIACDQSHRLVGHLAVLPRAFRGCGVRARAALSVDLLFDPEHRNFWNAVGLLRHAVDDLRADGGFDFIYSDPTAPAQGVLRAAGFAPIGQMRRFVLPLVAPYLALFAPLRGIPVSVTRRFGPPPDGAASWSLDSHFAGVRTPALYATRLGGTTIPTWEWYLVTSPASPSTPLGAVLARPDPQRRLLHVLDARWAQDRIAPACVWHGTARAAAAAGYVRLTAYAHAPSAFSRSLLRCGFLPRGPELPTYLLATPGAGALPPWHRWLLTAFDGSAW